jgi:hypothetical protein
MKWILFFRRSFVFCISLMFIYWTNRHMTSPARSVQNENTVYLTRRSVSLAPVGNMSQNRNEEFVQRCCLLPGDD